MATTLRAPGGEALAEGADAVIGGLCIAQP